MGQEFFINSQQLEDKVRQLLPSQGGAGSGFDLSASTQIIPIIDVTESAEGSSVRADIQTALSHGSCTSFSLNNVTNSVLINNTGYFRVFGCANVAGGGSVFFNLFDGSTTKNIYAFGITGVAIPNQYDFNIFLNTGDELRGTCSSGSNLQGVTRQIADIDGNLVNPT